MIVNVAVHATVRNKMNTLEQVFEDGMKQYLDSLNKSFDIGWDLAWETRNKEILNWIDEHRTEVTVGVYRDNFTSQDLIRFLENNDKA